jgi:predicted transcriptional regulator
MVRKDGAEARKERLQRIAQAIQAALHKEGELSLSKTMASLQYEFGLTKDRVQEYLEILENVGQFEIDKQNDKIKKARQSEPIG